VCARARVCVCVCVCVCGTALRIHSLALARSRLFFKQRSLALDLKEEQMGFVNSGFVF
jgi:hypothetical protein